MGFSRGQFWAGAQPKCSELSLEKVCLSIASVECGQLPDLGFSTVLQSYVVQIPPWKMPSYRMGNFNLSLNAVSEMYIFKQCSKHFRFQPLTKTFSSLNVSNHDSVLPCRTEAAILNNSAAKSHTYFPKSVHPWKGHSMVKVLDQNTEDLDSCLCLVYFVSRHVAFRQVKMQLSPPESPTAHFTASLEVKTPLKIEL